VSLPTLSVPRWAVVTTWLLSFTGLAISGYLTFTHYAGTQFLACAESGTINCAAVTTSAQSSFLGVPVAVLGLADYLVMVVINSPWAWRSPVRAVHVGRVVLVAASMAFVLWLVAAELLIIDHICLWCTGVHVVTLALLVVVSRVSPTQLGWTRSVPQ
jgi:uncharacterized membrane protein